MPDPEFISIIDCALCRAIPPSDKAVEYCSPSDLAAPPVPSSWGSLSTIAVLPPGFGWAWGDHDELRMCPSCGTYYEYRQVYDSGDVLRAEVTHWYLLRLTPHGAAARLARAKSDPQKSALRTVKRRLPLVIQALHSDLGRVQKDASLSVKRFVVEALTEHYRLAGDWDGLNTALLDHSDPAVRVETATRLLWMVLRAMDFGKRGPMVEFVTATNRLITRKRRKILLAVLAEALSHDGEMASHAGDEPARTDLTALSMLRRCGPYMRLAPAIPALAAWLAGDVAWRREKALSFLVQYVERPWRLSQGPRTEELRARDVLAHVTGIDSDEARAVARHCQAELGPPTEPAS